MTQSPTSSLLYAGSHQLQRWPLSECKTALDICSLSVYTHILIKSWKHKGLEELAAGKKTRHIQPAFHARIMRRLDALKAASKPEEMNFPGFNFHPLKGF